MEDRDYLLMFLNQYVHKVDEEHFKTFLRILIFKLSKNMNQNAFSKTEMEFLDFINIIDQKRRTSKELFSKCSKTLKNKPHPEINIPEYPKVDDLCNYIFPNLNIVKYDKQLSKKINTLVADYQYFIWNINYQEFYFEFLNALYPNMCPTNRLLILKEGDKFVFKFDSGNLKSCKEERFTMLLLSFQIPGLAHQNAIFIDNQRKTIERYEPYGFEYSFEMYQQSGFSMEDLDNSLKQFLNLNSYKTIYSSCPLQTVDEKFEQQYPLLLKPYGWCTLYSIIFLTFKLFMFSEEETIFFDKDGDVIMSGKKENKTILDKLLDFIKTENNFSSLNEFIYYYAAFIVAIFSLYEEITRRIPNLNRKRLVKIFGSVFNIFKPEDNKAHLMNFVEIPEGDILNEILKRYQSGGNKVKKIRKHRGINQTTGRLNKGYKYSGKKLKNGLSEIVKI